MGKESAGEDVSHLSGEGNGKEDRTEMGTPRRDGQELPKYGVLRRIRFLDETRQQDFTDQPLVRKEEVAEREAAGVR